MKNSALLFIIMSCFCNSLSSQIYLQIEIFNNPRTIKYHSNDVIEFKVKEYPDTWRKERIEEIIPDGNVLLFSDGFETIDNIIKVRRINPPAKYLGRALMVFAASYAIYGVIADFGFGDDAITGTNIGITGASLGTGFLLDKGFGQKYYGIGKTSRLRIVDLRFQVDVDD